MAEECKNQYCPMLFEHIILNQAGLAGESAGLVDIRCPYRKSKQEHWGRFRDESCGFFFYTSESCRNSLGRAVLLAVSILCSDK